MGKTPIVTQLSAITASTALACAFVGVLYTLPRSIRLLQRDNPAQIKARFAVLLVLCALTPYIVCYLLFGDFGSMGQTLLWLGIRADSMPRLVEPKFVVQGRVACSPDERGLVHPAESQRTVHHPKLARTRRRY